MNRPPRRRGREAPAPCGRVRRTPTAAKPGSDRLKEGHRMNPLLADQDVRQELVSRVRMEIQAGTYDTPEKLEAALDRLAARLDHD